MNHELSQPTLDVLAGVFRLVIPEIVLVAGACVLFLGATVRAGRNLWGAAALVTLAAAAVALYVWPGQPVPAEQLPIAPLVRDQLTLLTRVLAVAGAAVLVLCGWNEEPDRYAAHAATWVAAGATLVGGCCGAGPAHVAGCAKL